MPAFAKPPVRNAVAGRARARRVFARLMEGQSTRDVAAAEDLTVRRVQQIVRAELERREANPAEDYLVLQIARLERAIELLGRQIDDGKATAAVAFVRAIEMLAKLAQRPLQLVAPAFRLHGEVAAVAERLARLDAAREVVAARAAVAEAKRNGAQGVEKSGDGEIAGFVSAPD